MSITMPLHVLFSNNRYQFISQDEYIINNNNNNNNNVMLLKLGYHLMWVKIVL